MPRWLKVVLAFIAGLVLGEATAIVGYIIATNVFGVFDRDGGVAMGIVFVIGPALAVLVAIVAAVIVALRR